jgi:hypothetical protein
MKTTIVLTMEEQKRVAVIQRVFSPSFPTGGVSELKSE